MLVDMPPNREEWLRLRRQRIGASEVAALWDVHPYTSRYALWHIKAGRAEEPNIDTGRTKWGLRLEEVIAMAVAEEHGWTVRKGRYAICDDCPKLGASLDFEASQGGSPGALETKNTDFIAHRRAWTDDEPPLHITLQLQAQLAATGWQWGAVAALVGGNDLKHYPYEARPKLIAQIKQRVTEFYRSIEENRPPPIDGSDAASDVLQQLYPDLQDEAADMRGSNEWPEAVAAFLDAQEAQKAAKLAYETTRNRVMNLIAPSKRGYGGGFSANIIVRKASPGRVAEPGEIIGARSESRSLSAKGE